MRYFFAIFLLYLAPIYLFANSNKCQVVIDGIVLNGECKGVLRHGKFVGYYDNGVLAWEVHYKNGILHGAFRHFYQDGKLHFLGYYKDSRLHGSFTQYGMAANNAGSGEQRYSDEMQVLKAKFKNGVLHNWLNVYDGNAKLQSLKYYYGKLIRQDIR